MNVNYNRRKQGIKNYKIYFRIYCLNTLCNILQIYKQLNDFIKVPKMKVNWHNLATILTDVLLYYKQ